ncbi:hypothetical protein FHS23_001495 [Prauserella isguenensis]|uniref:Uncharacterized protein n=1 Tax=Prauserella isguenensis TaxID=1470180 RepID=A0A839S0A8_9PSEU|nr:hypothetical protein [Prauserella isguenensis]
MQRARSAAAGVTGAAVGGWVGTWLNTTGATSVPDTRG